jgi:hypothetical protein
MAAALEPWPMAPQLAGRRAALNVNRAERRHLSPEVKRRDAMDQVCPPRLV